MFLHGGYLLILALAAASALAGDRSFGGLMVFVALGGASSFGALRGAFVGCGLRV